LVLFATPAHAGNNEITIGSYERALRSSSADAVTADGLAGGSLTYARALDLSLVPRLTLWAEGSFGWGGATGTLFSTIGTQISNLGFTVGGRARYVPYRMIAVSGRIDVGTARTSLALHDTSGTATDSGWGAVTCAAIAADVIPVEKPRAGFGLRFELGYLAASGVTLTPQREGGGDTLKLPTMSTSLGSLNLSGPFVAFSFLGQF
jgi:hypothetical protein